MSSHTDDFGRQTAEFARFRNAGLFSTAEFHASVSIVRSVLGSTHRPELSDYLAVAAAVWAPSRGHVCADLSTIQAMVEREIESPVTGEIAEELPWPRNTKEWVAHLLDGPFASSADTAPEKRVTKPLVLNGTHLYLTRQWTDEGETADRLRPRLSAPQRDLDPSLDGVVREIFGAEDGGLQSAAARMALTRDTMVLLGGPGTGKTYTIAAILHLLHAEHELHRQDDGVPLRVALAAPTAKAARQMGRSISEALRSASFPQEHAGDLGATGNSATTLHRLLGTRRQNPGRFRHGRQNTLPYDVIVVDEFSMVSLALATRLLEALSPGTRLILVGDGAQLKSVESGAVLPEIARLSAGKHHFPIVTLTENRRQMNGPDGTLNRIGQFAALLRNPEKDGGGDDYVTPILDFLRAQSEEITWVELPDDGPTSKLSARLIPQLKTDLHDLVAAVQAAKSGDAETSLGLLASTRILCGHREGPFGVGEWNRSVAAFLGVPLSIDAPGTALVNTKNDPRTGLANGDPGIVVDRNGRPTAAFVIPRRDAQTNEPAAAPDEIGYFEPSSVPHCDFAFATTIHKAQGSQFRTAVVVCPPHTSPLATRELIYTAATRATHRLVIIGSPKALAQAIQTNPRRETGLAKRICEGLQI